MPAHKKPNPPSSRREYKIWDQIKQRCLNPNHSAYGRYGAKGISICAEWRTDFQRFIDDVGPRPSARHWLRRIDAKGDFTASNVQWETNRCAGLRRRSEIRNLAGKTRLPYNTAKRLTLLGWTPPTVTPAEYALTV